jgi:diacylglycerol kinase (ATP)
VARVVVAVAATSNAMNACVILNPHSGSADEAAAVHACLEHLRDVQIQTTSYPGEALRLAREAVSQGYDLVIAAGGDGTINEVINGLADDFHRACLGIIPLGTGNDFVRTINVPSDVAEACQIVLANQRRSIDVVRVTSDETRYFLNVSAGGFTGIVDEKLTAEMKRTWGPLAYLRSAVEALPELTEYCVTLHFDDGPAQQFAALNVIVANARYAGGGIPVAPTADIDDGLLDVLIVPSVPVSQLAVLVSQMWLGRHHENPDIIYQRARKVAVSSEPAMWFNVDGEVAGNEPSTFEVLPRALQVIVGPEPTTQR